MVLASIEDFAAAAVVAQTLILTIGLVYGLRQVQEARRAREASVILDVFQRLHSREASARRHRLYRDLKQAPRPLSAELENDVRQTINEFDLLGYLTLQKVVPKSAVLSIYYATTIRVWNATFPYIAEQRQARGTTYGQYFEQLAEICRVETAERRPLEQVRDLGPVSVK
jgi:hypothetical protein